MASALTAMAPHFQTGRSPFLIRVLPSQFPMTQVLPADPGMLCPPVLGIQILYVHSTQSTVTACHTFKFPGRNCPPFPMQLPSALHPMQKG